jgi:ABC-type lipoprotein release transport system permease subunit
MTLYLRLAWRNIWRHRRRTLIVVLAIGFTLALMMFYDGIIAGFDTAIYSNAIKVLGGNVQIHAAGYHAKAAQTPLLPLPDTTSQAVLAAARGLPQVTAASQRITTGGLVTDREGAFAVSIIGIQPEKELPVNLIAQHVVAGRYLTSADQDLIFIGRGLATALDVNVEDRVTLTGRATHDQMRQRTMTVGGIYDVGMADIEKTTVYMSLAEAQDLYGLPGQATEIIISLQQLGQEGAVINALKPQATALEMESWETNYPDLQATIAAKSKTMDLFTGIILVIVGIGILNLLLMAVYERTREIGILGAFGMKPGQISILFLLEGAMLGLVGVAIGVLMGIGLNLLIAQVGLDFSAFSSLTSYTALVSGKIYPSLGLEKLAAHSLTVLIITVLASYYPAREAARREPAAALHST